MNKFEVIALNLAGLYLLFLVVKNVRLFFWGGLLPVVYRTPEMGGKLIAEIGQERLASRPKICLINNGKIGFLPSLVKAFPAANIQVYETVKSGYLVKKLQVSRADNVYLTFTKEPYHVKVDDADLIFCDLSVETLAELSHKFKFECQPGTVLISRAVPVPNLNESRAVDLFVPKQPSKWLFWRKNTAMAKPKGGDNWVYFYQI